MIADDPCDPTPCGSYTNPPKLLEIDVIARVVHPCNPSSCGMNAECFENRGAASCSCILDYVGNPYVECKPEFTINPECPRDKSCNNHKWRSLSGCLWCPCNLLSYQFSSLCVTQVTPEMLLVTHKNNNSFTKNSINSGSEIKSLLYLMCLINKTRGRVNLEFLFLFPTLVTIESFCKFCSK